jgi:hypothetical protein
MNKNHHHTLSLLALVVALAFTSCQDWLTIYPTDKIVGENYWKKKSDVEEMVTGAYKAMIDGGIQERAIIWGGFRSDELTKTTSWSNSDLENTEAVILTSTNGMNNWASFYTVINDCNIVLNHAPAVRDLDPEYTEGDYQSDRAQMLALRSLCYFYLVRAFRDVPYTTTSYENDSESPLVAQLPAGAVLDSCMASLKEAEPHIVHTGGYGAGDWRNVGLFTLDAVHALMADISLWKAAMTHQAADYQAAADYAEMVLTSKDAYYRSTHGASVITGGDRYHLYSGAQALEQVFMQGNSSESILEWQYDGKNNANTTLAKYYWKTSSGSSISGLMASKCFAVPNNGTNTNTAFTNIDGANYIFDTSRDYRYWNVVANVDPSVTSPSAKPIRKLVDDVPFSSPLQSGSQNHTGTYNEFSQNWIVYRITDLMLMKAEALVELSSDMSDSRMQEAFDLVKTVNQRSLVTNPGLDSLNRENYNSKERMEKLVLAERERELCFEGKRWFDLVRYAYRHMEGVEPYKLMTDMNGSYPAIYTGMLDLVERKYEAGSSAFSLKMRGEPYLYWPVLQSEIKVNALLKQNPVYKDE